MSDTAVAIDSGPEEASAPTDTTGGDYKTPEQIREGQDFHRLQNESDYRSTHETGPQAWPSPSGGHPSRWTDGGPGGEDGRSGGAEFEDLALVKRFANEIVALGEGSDFAQVIKGCGTVHEIIRDFGGDMNRSVREFVEAAIRVERDGIALRDQAAQVAGLANDLSGEGGG